MFYDAHCHYVYVKGKFYEDFVIAAVSVDYNSSVETLRIQLPNIIKGVAIHPWRVHEEDIERIIPLIKQADFVGELGLDYKYSIANKEKQVEYFTRMIEESDGKTLNVHSINSWEEVLNILLNKGVKRAIIHWYSGPIRMLKDIEGAGYFITINPSFVFQRKHREVAEKVPLDILLTESDGGYVYRGKMLEPYDIVNAVEELSKVRGIETKELHRIIEDNFKKAFQISIRS
jgi:Mg-dependent DNase